jgi:putative ABC transport system permease protein
VSVLDHKLRRDLRAAKGLLATIIILITIGIMSFVMFLTLAINLDSSLQSYYSQCRMADFWVDLEKTPLGDLDRLSQIPGISEYRPRISFPVSLDIEGSARPVSGLALSLPDDPAPVINSVVIRSGGYFTNLRREEVILSDGFARVRNIRPGAVINVLLNGKSQELHVVGTAMASEFALTIPPGGLPDNQNFVILFLKQSFAEEAFDYQGAANQVVGLLTPDYRDRPQRVFEAIETQLRPFGEPQVSDRDDQPAHSLLSARINQMRTVNLIIPSLFLIVAALMMNILMMRMVEQQRTIIGTLKAIGYSNRILRRHFLKFGLVVGISGGLGGAIAGQYQSGVILGQMRKFFEFPRLESHPIPLLLMAAVLLSIGIAALGTWNGVRGVLMLSPAAAMRPQPPDTMHRNFLERLGLLWKRIGFRWQMAIRNIFRQRLRTATNLFASTMGTAIILLVLHMTDAIEEMLAFTYEKVLVSDVDLTFNDELPYSSVYEAVRLPGVARAEPILAVPGTFENDLFAERGAILGILPDGTMTIPRTTDGQRVPLASAGLLVSNRLADQLHVRVGDTLTFRPRKGNRDELKLPVAQIIESYAGAAVYADYRYLNPLVAEEDAVSRVQLKLKPVPSALPDLYAALKEIPHVQQMSSAHESKLAMEENMGAIKIMVSVMIVCAGALFCGSLLTSTLIALAERRQEVATFRVLGYQPGAVAGIFLRESLVINIIGIAIGLPIGRELAWRIDQFMATDVVTLPFVITGRSYIMTVVLGITFTLAAQLLVFRVIQRFEWKGALNAKE